MLRKMEMIEWMCQIMIDPQSLYLGERTESSIIQFK